MKKVTQTKPMGTKKANEPCMISGCSETSSHHLAQANIEGYLEKLSWTYKDSGTKTKRIALCKKHYKSYKKLLDKDEKFSKFKDFDHPKGPKRDKSHAYLE